MPYGILYPLEYEFPGTFGDRNMEQKIDQTVSSPAHQPNMLFIPNPASNV